MSEDKRSLSKPELNIQTQDAIEDDVEQDIIPGESFFDITRRDEPPGIVNQIFDDHDDAEPLPLLNLYKLPEETDDLPSTQISGPGTAKLSGETSNLGEIDLTGENLLTEVIKTEESETVKAEDLGIPPESQVPFARATDVPVRIVPLELEIESTNVKNYQISNSIPDIAPVIEISPASVMIIKSFRDIPEVVEDTHVRPQDSSVSSSTAEIAPVTLVIKTPPVSVMSIKSFRDTPEVVEDTNVRPQDSSISSSTDKFAPVASVLENSPTSVRSIQFLRVLPEVVEDKEVRTDGSGLSVEWKTLPPYNLAPVLSVAENPIEVVSMKSVPDVLETEGDTEIRIQVSGDTIEPSILENPMAGKVGVRFLEDTSEPSAPASPAPVPGSLMQFLSSTAVLDFLVEADNFCDDIQCQENAENAENCLDTGENTGSEEQDSNIADMVGTALMGVATVITQLASVDDLGPYKAYEKLSSYYSSVKSSKSEGSHLSAKDVEGATQSTIKFLTGNDSVADDVGQVNVPRSQSVPFIQKYKLYDGFGYSDMGEDSSDETLIIPIPIARSSEYVQQDQLEGLAVPTGTEIPTNNVKSVQWLGEHDTNAVDKDIQRANSNSESLYVPLITDDIDTERSEYVSQTEVADAPHYTTTSSGIIIETEHTGNPEYSSSRNAGGMQGFFSAPASLSSLHSQHPR